MRFEPAELHNVAELLPAGDGAHRIQRVPEAVRRQVNDGAARMLLRPAGAEIRGVPAASAGSDATLRVTLSTTGSGTTEVTPFFGPFQGRDRYEIGSDPTTVEVAPADRLREAVPDDLPASSFDPSVWRLVLYAGPASRWQPDLETELLFHGVSGPVRPPRSDELPERRLLTYGTSITQGVAATHAHLTYAWQAARRLGMDLLNLGTSGHALCDPALADHVADRDDWDAAVFSLSVNMIGHGFDQSEFRERAAYLVESVAEAHPDKPVLCVTVFPYYRDHETEEPPEENATPAEYRAALREVVASAPGRVSLVEGPEILEETGLTDDLLHPGDFGMAQIGEGIADALADEL